MAKFFGRVPGRSVSSPKKIPSPLPGAVFSHVRKEGVLEGGRLTAFFFWNRTLRVRQSLGLLRPDQVPGGVLGGFWGGFGGGEGARGRGVGGETRTLGSSVGRSFLMAPVLGCSKRGARNESRQLLGC